MSLDKISRFVIWICSKFTREQIEVIIKQLTEILESKNFSVKPKDAFKQNHPNYRNFKIDPKPPLSKPLKKK